MTLSEWKEYHKKSNCACNYCKGYTAEPHRISLLDLPSDHSQSVKVRSKSTHLPKCELDLCASLVAKNELGPSLCFAHRVMTEDDWDWVAGTGRFGQ